MRRGPLAGLTAVPGTFARPPVALQPGAIQENVPLCLRRRIPRPLGPGTAMGSPVRGGLRFGRHALARLTGPVQVHDLSHAARIPAPGPRSHPVP